MANRFLVAGGTGNWNSTTNWAATSGGASGASFPVAGDVVALDSLSGNANLTVNVASACASLVASGTYAGTLTFTSTLTLTSTCTFVAGMTVAGTAGTLALGGGGTFTSGGKTLTCALTLNAGPTTYTFADDWTVNGLVSLGASGGITVNGVGKTLTCAGGLTTTTGAGTSGSMKFKLTGGTWSNSSTGVLGNALDLAGNITVSGTVRHDTGAITYVSGAVTTTGSTLAVTTGGTLDVSAVTWEGVSLGASSTYTLTSDLVWSGTLTIANTGAVTIAGAGKVNGTGGITLTGTATLTINTTGGPMTTTGTLTLPNGAMTFAGSTGYTVGTQTTATLNASRTHTLTFGNTYTVTAALTNAGTTPTVRQAIKSSSAGNKVVFTLSPGATTTLTYCDPTDVDSSAGATVYSIGGTITTSLNWAGSVTAGSSVPRFGLRGLLFTGNETPMDIPLDEVVYVEGIASSSVGAAVDADSTPTFAVYEEATDTDIGVGGNMTKRTSLTGDYRGSFTASAANGFELGKWYHVIGSATVGGVAAKAVLRAFRIKAAENTQGYPTVDVMKVNNTAQTAGDLAALLNSLVSATGAGDLTTKTADSATLTTGTTVSGAYTDTATDNDVFWITAPVTPAVGGFGLRQQLVFNLTLGRVPVGVYLRGWFNGTGRSADVYALNSRTGVYDKLTNSTTNLASRTTELAYTFTLPRDYADSSGGSFNVVTLELRSTSTTTADRLRVDQLLVTHVAESSPTTLVAPSVADIWGYVSRTLTTPGVEPAAAPTAAQVADAVWDEVMSDHLTAGSTGAGLNAAGSAGGTVDANIVSVNGTTFAGANAPAKLADAVAHGGTTATLRLGGSSATPTLYVTNSGGDAVKCESTGGDGVGLELAGAGAGPGLKATGGATAAGLYLVGGSSSGQGLRVYSPHGDGISSYAPGGNGVVFQSDDVNYAGLLLSGGGPGLQCLGFSGNAGVYVTGTEGLYVESTSGHAVHVSAAGTNRHGIYVTGGTGGVSDGVRFNAGTGGVALRAATIQGDLGGRVLGNTATAFAGDGVQASVSGLLDAAGVRSAVGLASANLDTQLGTIAGYVDTEVAAIKAKTDNLPASFPANFAALAVTAAGGVTLADGVAHGGTPGSSTATLAFSRLAGASQTADQPALKLTGNGTAAAAQLGDGTNGAGGLRVLAGPTGAGVEVVSQAGNGVGVSASGAAAVAVSSTDSDGVTVQGNGGAGLSVSGGAGPGVLVAGSLAGLSVSGGGGAFHDVSLDGDGVLGGKFSAAGLAAFFNTNSGSTYAGAVAGSVVKEVVANAGAGVTLADGAITDAKFTLPAEAAGSPTGFMARLMWLTARLGLRRVRKDATTVKTYLADGTTVATTQAYTSAGTTDDVGAAA